MENSQLGWSWFDPLYCWENLHELWMDSRLKDHLRPKKGVDAMPMTERKTTTAH